MSIMPPEPDSNTPNSPEACTSQYNAGRGLWLHCTGKHLLGNFIRGGDNLVHQQQYGGISWTWYSDEADVTRGDV